MGQYIDFCFCVFAHLSKFSMYAWGKKGKILVFTGVYVCVKAKLTLVSFFFLVFFFAPHHNNSIGLLNSSWKCSSQHGNKFSFFWFPFCCWKYALKETHAEILPSLSRVKPKLCFWTFETQHMKQKKISWKECNFTFVKFI